MPSGESSRTPKRGPCVRRRRLGNQLQRLAARDDVVARQERLGIFLAALLAMRQHSAQVAFEHGGHRDGPGRRARGGRRCIGRLRAIGRGRGLVERFTRRSLGRGAILAILLGPAASGEQPHHVADPNASRRTAAVYACDVEIVLADQAPHRRAQCRRGVCLRRFLAGLVDRLRRGLGVVRLRVARGRAAVRRRTRTRALKSCVKDR